MSVPNSVNMQMTFPSPAEAVPVAERLAQEGWEVTLSVTLEAHASGTSEHLQKLHDRLKEIAPELGLNAE